MTDKDITSRVHELDTHDCLWKLDLSDEKLLIGPYLDEPIFSSCDYHLLLSK
jgi:hypothetical protein